MSEARLAPESRELVWFSGPDAVRFLNDLISQEIAELDPGTVVRSLLLGPRGKLDHILWALRGVERVGLVTDAGRGADLAAKLGRYRIRVEVDIEEPVPGWLLVGDERVQPGEWRETDGRILAGLPWGGSALTLGTGPRPGLPELSAEEMERMRILAREPRFGVDVDESTIPQESGLVSVSVDFDKGCYLGQELVARIDSRGHVNRHLRLIQVSDGVGHVGDDIVHDGVSVGVVTSASDSVALGLVRREVSPGSEVVVGSSSGLVLE